jgi:hypothetical protein
VTVARPVVVAHGDILGVAFDGEDEAVLFVPHSGDVLISEIGQWRELIAPRADDSAASADSVASVDNALAANVPSLTTSLTENESPAAELRATLRQLGVQLA